VYLGRAEQRDAAVVVLLLALLAAIEISWT
jgi:hypothetical protein